jgi:hypothetical protein
MPHSAILLPLFREHGHQSRPNLVAGSRLTDLRSHMDSRFDDMRATWHSELRRVEEVLDAGLKHLEER